MAELSKLTSNIFPTQSADFQASISESALENLLIEVQKDPNAQEGKLGGLSAQELKQSHVVEPQPKLKVTIEATHTVNIPQVKSLNAVKQEEVNNRRPLVGRAKRKPPQKPPRALITTPAAQVNPSPTVQLPKQKIIKEKVIFSKISDSTSLFKMLRLTAKSSNKTIIKEQLKPFMNDLNTEINSEGTRLYNHTNKLKAIEEELKEPQEKIKKNKEKVESLTKRLSEISLDSTGHFEKETVAINKEIDTIKNEIDAIKGKVDTLEQEKEELVRSISTLDSKVKDLISLKMHLHEFGVSAFKEMMAKSASQAQVADALTLIDGMLTQTVTMMNEFQTSALRIIENAYSKNPDKKSQLENQVRYYHNKGTISFNSSVERKEHVTLWGMTKSFKATDKRPPTTLEMVNAVTSPQKGITATILPKSCEVVHQQCVLSKIKELKLNLINPIDEFGINDKRRNLEQFKRVFDEQTAQNLNEKYSETHNTYKRRTSKASDYIKAAEEFIALLVISEPKT